MAAPRSAGRRRDAALRRAESRLEGLLAIGTDAIISIDQDQRITSFNRGAEIMFGYHASEVLGQALDILLPSGRVEAHRQHVRQFAAAPEQSRFMDRRPGVLGRRKDGAEFPAEASITKLAQDGETWFTAVVRDITQRRQAEGALQRLNRELEQRVAESATRLDMLSAQEQLLASIYITLPDPLYLLSVESDDQFRFLSINEAFLHATGLTRDQIVGQRVIDVLPPSSHALVTGKYKEAIANGLTVRWEEVATFPAGKRVGAVSITPIQDESGSVSRLVGSVRDITQEREAQEALAELNKVLEQRVAERTAELEAVIQSAPLAIYTTDQERVVRRWNPAAERIFGWTAAEVLGQVLPTLTEHEEVLEITRGRLLDGEWITNWETKRRRKDGSLMDVRVAAAPLADAAGAVTGFVSVVSDISDEKRAQEEQRRLTAELEAAVKELEAFSYSVSHDLRAPLRAVDGFSRILQEEFGPQAPLEAQRYLGIVRGSARQMGQLIDDLLAFSRLSRQPLNRQPVLLHELARQALEELRQEQEGRQVEMVLPELPPCWGDPALLRQAVINLLSNALKFTRRREVARIEMGYRSEGGAQVYYLQDNGVGFDMRYQDKLFGVFQRLHPAAEYEGTGVGLAIVQRIIYRHGGRVWAQGEPDKGATFFFTLQEAPYGG